MIVFPIHSTTSPTLHVGPVLQHATASPLCSLLLNLELEQLKHDSSPYLQRAYRNARYLQTLLSSPQEIYAFCPHKALNEVVTLLTPQHPRTLIRTHFTNKRLSILGNKLLFQEAAACVIKNAVESYRQSSKQRLVLITSSSVIKEHSHQVDISFIDGGCGMNIITKTFVLADGWSNKHSGKGVGLRWSRAVIRKHFHGSVRVHSKRERGTTVCWKLPISN